MITLDDQATPTDNWGSLTVQAIDRVSTDCVDSLREDPSGEEVATDLRQRVSAILDSKNPPRLNLVSHLMSLTQAADALKTYSESRDPSDLEFSRALLSRAN